MEKFIQTRWNTLQPDGRDGRKIKELYTSVKDNLNLVYLAIRNFIVNVIVKVSSDEATLKKERTYINKLNMVLVQVSYQ